MTIKSVGYDGSIGEIDWAAYMAPYLGMPDGVATPQSFKVTAASTGLAVQISPGVAYGSGVTDVSDALETVQLAPVTSGSRFDVIVIRRDWSGTSTTPTNAPTGGRTSIEVVTGGTSASTVPSMTRNPGVRTDYAIALVQVSAGQSTVKVVEDLRAVHSKAAWVSSMLAMTGPAGTRYALAPDGRRYVMAADANGAVTPRAEWEPAPPVYKDPPLIGSGTAAVTTNQYGSATISHNLGWTPKVAMVTPRLSTNSALVVAYIAADSTGITSRTLNIKMKIATATGWQSYQGNIGQLDWIAYG